MIKWLIKKFFAIGCALVCLVIFNNLGIPGFAPGVNLINASLIGIMGVPGIISVIGLNILL